MTAAISVATLATVESGVVLAADAESLIREGIAQRRAGDDAAALKLFEQAYATKQTPRALIQIGLAEQALGRWVPADQHLRQALLSAEDSWITKNHASITEALRVVSQHLGELDIVGTPPGAEVRVDGELVGHLPLSHHVTSTVGGVAIEVRATGYLSIVRSTTVAAGTLTRESFKLQALPSAADTAAGPTGAVRGPGAFAPEPPGTSAVPRSGPERPETHQATTSSASAVTDAQPLSGGEGGSVHRVATLTAAGLGVISLGFAVVEHLAWQHNVNAFGGMNTATNTVCAVNFPMKGSSACMKLYDDGQTARTRALVGYGLAAGLALTATILYLTEPSEPARRSERQTVACGPIFGAPGVHCAFRF